MDGTEPGWERLCLLCVSWSNGVDGGDDPLGVGRVRHEGRRHVGAARQRTAAAAVELVIPRPEMIRNSESRKKVD